MSDGGVGFYWTKSAFIPDFVGVRVLTTGYYLSLMDSAQEADKGNIRSFTAQIKCFFGKCSPCLSLVPKSGATPSFVGLGLSFIASYGDAVLLDGLKNSCLSVIFQETACPA